jgi:hypothetical protein
MDVDLEKPRPSSTLPHAAEVFDPARRRLGGASNLDASLKIVASK